MHRFASPILKVAFEGPDIQEQALYELCRVCTSRLFGFESLTSSTAPAIRAHKRYFASCARPRRESSI